MTNTYETWAGDAAVAGEYAVTEIEGVQIFRDLSAGPVYQPGWLVRCRCGYKAGPYVGIEMAELMRGGHETSCLWPRS